MCGHKQNIIVKCFQVLRFSIESWSHSCCIPTCSRRWTVPPPRPVLSCPHSEEPPGLHPRRESERSGWNQQPLKPRQAFGLSMPGTFLDPDPSWAERWDFSSTDQMSPLHDRHWQKEKLKKLKHDKDDISLFFTWISHTSPPARASTGEDDGSYELSSTQFHSVERGMAVVALHPVH